MLNRGSMWAVIASLACVMACGPEVSTPEEVEMLNAGAEELFLAEGDPGPANALSTETETALLARFWAVDRFVLDGEVGIPIVSDYRYSLLAKAKADECFNGIGADITRPDASGACATGRPKVNDAYVWGLTRSGDNVFFGTLANTLCLVESGFLDVTEPQQTALWVCEFGKSKSGTGDFRSPNTFMYTKANGAVSLNAATDAKTPLRRGTTGLRSAGSLGNVVFLAGPASGGGVNFLAYKGATGESLGGLKYLSLVGRPGFTLTNVRQWVVANGHLYVGVGTTKYDAERRPIDALGAVLKWTGTETDPFHFEEVGYLPDDAANMTFHSDGRIYVTTWPGKLPAGLYRSPVVPKTGGLTALAHAGDPSWMTPLWLATKSTSAAAAGVPWYDPDPTAGAHYGGGAIASYKDRIYFGTMHVPFVAAQDAMGDEELAIPEEDLLRTALGTHRSISLFEVKFPADMKVEVSMIFGERYLPIYEGANGGYTIRYDAAHRTGFEPRWGSSGFGNFFNTYTWAMAVHRDELFVGTFDWSQLARAMIETMVADPEAAAGFAPVQVALLDSLGTGLPREGADLIRIRGGRVQAESATGLGNDRNYGVRNLLTDGNTLYVGTANPMNLDPKGGWELVKLTPR